MYDLLKRILSSEISTALKFHWDTFFNSVKSIRYDYFDHKNITLIFFNDKNDFFWSNITFPHASDLYFFNRV